MQLKYNDPSMNTFYYNPKYRVYLNISKINFKIKTNIMRACGHFISHVWNYVGLKIYSLI